MVSNYLITVVLFSDPALLVNLHFWSLLLAKGLATLPQLQLRLLELRPCSIRHSHPHRRGSPHVQGLSKKIWERKKSNRKNFHFRTLEMPKRGKKRTKPWSCRCTHPRSAWVPDITWADPVTYNPDVSSNPTSLRYDLKALQNKQFCTLNILCTCEGKLS